MVSRSRSELSYRVIVGAAGPGGAVPPPAPVVALAGDEAFLKRDLEERMARALAGDPVPAGGVVRMRPGTGREDRDPREILDEVRTPGLFVPRKVVVAIEAEAFAREFAAVLLELLETEGLPGVLVLEVGALDGRTRLGAALRRRKALIQCRKPFDRPPPWRPDMPPWKTELVDWLVLRAREKGLAIEARDAHRLRAHAGSQLGVLDEELEKLRTRLGERRRVTAEDIDALAPDASRDSIFDLVDSLVAGDTAGSLERIDRLCRNGYLPAKGSPVHDVGTIAILAVAALAKRLRTLRRAHALLARGARPQDLVDAGLVARPFLPRLQRDLAAFPAASVAPAFRRLLEADRGLKGIDGQPDPRAVLEWLAIRLGAGARRRPASR